MSPVNYMKKKFHQYVDIEMIPAKVTFFFTDGYFGSTVPFMNNFYVSLGLTPTHAGFISGISLLVSSVFNPIWSTLADITGYRKLIFIILCIGTGSTVFSMPWIELAVAKTNTTTFHANVTVNESVTYTSEKHLLNVNTLFYTMLILNIIAWIFYTSLRCYVDGTVTNVANTRETKKSYGPQRAVSCAGYAIFNFLTGIIADYYKPKNMSSYTAIFYVFLPCVICMIPIGCVLINQAKWDQTDKVEKKKKGDVLWQFLILFKKVDFFVFFLSVIMEGLVLNVFNCFFFMLMEHEMQSSTTLMSSALVLGVVFEITMFTIAARVIKLLGGTINSLIIGIFSFFPRFLIMSYVHNPWCVIATQPLHAFGMGLAWTSIVEHTYEIVPNDIKVTAIALMSSIVFIATSAVSNMAGGVLYDHYGGRALFRYVGVIAGAWSLFMALFYGIKRSIAKSKTEQTPTYPQGISQNVDLENDVGM